MESVVLKVDVKTEIRKQFNELSDVYSDLVLSEDAPGKWVVRGNLHFSATFEAITIEDTFIILILLPRDYPSSPPIVQETGGRIPRDFHTHVDGSLCLGAPFAVRMEFLKNPRLLPFINNQVVPFLFSFRYWQDEGKMPFGELSHGIKGVLEYYRDLFQVKEDVSVLRLLKILADNSYRGHLPCPCGSAFNLRRCHGAQLKDLMIVQSADRFFQDMVAILFNLPEEEVKVFGKSILPKDLLKRYRK